MMKSTEYGELKLMKKDQGKGSAMEPMRQARLFNPFEQMRQANITCQSMTLFTSLGSTFFLIKLKCFKQTKWNFATFPSPLQF